MNSLPGDFDTDRFRAVRDDDTIDLKKIFLNLFRNWQWLAVSLLVAMGVAFSLIRYMPREYEVRATLLLDGENYRSPLSALYGRGQEMFQGADYLNDWTSIYNQMAIVGSTPIVSQTLNELSFEISTYSLGRVTHPEKYNDVPFRVAWDKYHPQLIETDILLHIFPDRSIDVRIEGENAAVFDYAEGRLLRVIPKVSHEAKLLPGAALRTNEFSFSVMPDEDFDPYGPGSYKIRFHSPVSLVRQYRSKLNVFLPKDNTSILHLTVLENSPEKGIDFLTRLIEVYQRYDLGKKNEQANRTTRFIESQLQNISDSLTVSETRLENFRSAFSMIDFSTQSQQLLREISDLDRELVTRETQNSYYNYLRDYITNAREPETAIVPSAMGIDDPLLNDFIGQLNELIREKSGQTAIRENSQHPAIVKLNTQMEIVRNSLGESISNVIERSDAELNDLRERIGAYNTKIRRLPATERNFINFERRYRIDSETYTFLLQKLAEAQIARASGVPGSQVIEEPQMTLLVRPQSKKMYLLALLLGFLLPAGVITVGSLFNSRILSKEDLEILTDYPVIGSVFQNHREYAGSTLLLDKPGSRASEPYRDIRNKLNLMVKGIATPVIAVLSASANEGKSYNVINIASSYAIMQKRTVILDLDLRNPAMKSAFKIPTDLGVVNYLTGNAALEEITFHTKDPLLDVIPAGPKPPNPAEILLIPGLIGLISRLREEYNMVVIDSAPVGIVSDIFPLNDLIDASVFIVRHKYTQKQSLKVALGKVEQFQMSKVGIVVNATTPGKQGYG